MGKIDLGRVQGKSIASIKRVDSDGNDDTYEVMLDDNTPAGQFTVKNGINGTNGTNGRDGADGAPGKDGTRIMVNGDMVSIFDADAKSDLPTCSFADASTTRPLSANAGMKLNLEKAPTSHASADTTHGISTATEYGHAKASSVPPLMNGIKSGVEAVGDDNGNYAREGHVHPTDTSRAAATHNHNTEIIDLIYPKDSIYMSVNSTNPGILFGRGTWVPWGAGRVPVGISTNDTDFNASEKLGGAKNSVASHNHNHTHTITVDKTNPDVTGGSTASTTTTSHNHGIAIYENYGSHSFNKSLVSSTTGNNNSTARGDSSGAFSFGYTMGGDHAHGLGNHTHTLAHDHTFTVSNNNASTGTSNGNLQPYIVCYMWKRTG